MRVLDFVIKELRQMRRDPRLIGMLIGMPIIQLLLYGYAVSTDIRHLKTVICDSTAPRRAGTSFAGSPRRPSTSTSRATSRRSPRFRRILTRDARRSRSSFPPATAETSAAANRRRCRFSSTGATRTRARSPAATLARSSPPRQRPSCSAHPSSWPQPVRERGGGRPGSGLV